MDSESFNGDRTEIRIEGLSYAYNAGNDWEAVSLVVTADTDLTVMENDLRAHGFFYVGNNQSIFDGNPVVVVTAHRAIAK